MKKKHHFILAALVLLLCLVAYNAAGQQAGQASQVPEVFSPAQPQRNLASQQFLGIQSVDTRLIAVGERGLIVYSDDNAETWTQASVPVSVTLTAVHFPSKQMGWAVGHGGVILHSEDGGESWALQFDGNKANAAWLDYTRSDLQARRQALLAGDADAAAVEDAEFEYEDAVLAVETGPNDPFLDVAFTDNNNGLAVGAYGMIYQTSNGGQSWQLRASSEINAQRYHLYSIANGDAGQVFVSGELGTLLRSEDGGSSWQALAAPYDGSLYGIARLPGQKLMTFGLRGHVFVSEDQGQQWQQQDSGSTASLFSAALLATGEIVLCGSAGLILSRAEPGGEFAQRFHSSRDVFSAIARAGSGDLVLAGLGGLSRVAWQKAADRD